MKIFNRTKNFPDKVNFVDENNVVLGYDLYQQCCENAGWFIADSNKLGTDARESAAIADETIDLPGWMFDPTYSDETDDGSPIFRITRGNEEKFIYLYNVHNGYYYHGFEFSVDGKKILGGYI